jgi:hypothetical protein
VGWDYNYVAGALMMVIAIETIRVHLIWRPCARPLVNIMADIMCTVQDFMKVYAMLREELAQDPLLGDQTAAARQWLVEVSGMLSSGALASRALECASVWQ